MGWNPWGLQLNMKFQTEAFPGVAQSFETSLYKQCLNKQDGFIGSARGSYTDISESKTFRNEVP